MTFLGPSFPRKRESISIDPVGGLARPCGPLPAPLPGGRSVNGRYDVDVLDRGNRVRRLHRPALGFVGFHEDDEGPSVSPSSVSGAAPIRPSIAANAAS